MPQQLKIRISVLTVYQPLPSSGNRLIALEATKLGDDAKLHIKIEQMDIVKQMILDLLDVFRLDARVTSNFIHIVSAASYGFIGRISGSIRQIGTSLPQRLNSLH